MLHVDVTWMISDLIQFGMDSYLDKGPQIATTLFRTLNRNLDPRIFVVALIDYKIYSPDEDEELPDVGVLPSQSGRVTASLKKMRSSYGDLDVESVSEKIENVLRKVHPSRVTFAQFLGRAEYHEYYAVLQLEADAYGVAPSVPRNTIRFPANSLTQSTVFEFLEDAAHSHSLNPSEILRRAGSRLIKDTLGAQMDGMPPLFEAVDVVSTMAYEGSAGHGKILVISSDEVTHMPRIELDPPIPLTPETYRKARKVIQMSSGSTCLLMDAGMIYGLCVYKDKSAHTYSIEFNGRHTWTFSLGSKALMQVANGEPSVPKQPLEREDVSRILTDFFGETAWDAGAKEKLWKLVESAMKQKKGTMLVISEHARQEALRLKEQTISIKAAYIPGGMDKTVTAIDGAVLVDLSGHCHALGVILDGVAGQAKKGIYKHLHCDASRGARYNSAVRYLQSRKERCLIVVVSEDGMVNVLPEPTSGPGRFKISAPD